MLRSIHAHGSPSLDARSAVGLAGLSPWWRYRWSDFRLRRWRRLLARTLTPWEPTHETGRARAVPRGAATSAGSRLSHWRVWGAGEFLVRERNPPSCLPGKDRKPHIGARRVLRGRRTWAVDHRRIRLPLSRRGLLGEHCGDRPRLGRRLAVPVRAGRGATAAGRSVRRCVAARDDAGL